MALTLIEAGKLTQDLLLRGVIETIVSESQVLQYLPFMDVTGNGITFSEGKLLDVLPDSLMDNLPNSGLTNTEFAP